MVKSRHVSVGGSLVAAICEGAFDMSRLIGHLNSIEGAFIGGVVPIKI